MTSEEKKKYVLNYFYDKFNNGKQPERDEFTDELKTFIVVNEWIDFQFDDVKFDGIHSKNFSEVLQSSMATIDAGFDEALRITRETFTLDKYYEPEAEKIENQRMDAKRKKLDEFIAVAKKWSRMRVQLFISVDEENAKPEYVIYFKFTNESHHRDLDDMRIFVKTKAGDKMELKMTKLDFKQYDDEHFGFADEVNYYATEEDIKVLTGKGNRVSLRFDNIMNVDGTVEGCQYAASVKEKCEFLQLVKKNGKKAAMKAYEENRKVDKKYAQETIDGWVSDAESGEVNFDTEQMSNLVPMVHLFVEAVTGTEDTFLTDEEIDRLYDFCLADREKAEIEAQEWKKFKKKEEDYAKKEKQLKKFENAVRDALNPDKLSINDFVAVMDKLHTDPMQIKSVKELSDYCSSTGMKSEKLNWLTQATGACDIDALKKWPIDEKKCRKKYVIGAALIVIMIVLGIVIKMNGWLIALGIVLGLGIVLWGLSETGNKEAAKFIEEFKKRF